MRFRVFRALAAVMVALLAVQVVAPGSASAHERRSVGKYNFVVGFVSEPAYEGQPNGALVRITDAATSEPVAGAEQTLKVAVAFGVGQPKEFPLQAQFGQPGSYVARFIPTRSGAYIFTFTGAIGDQPVNEVFESGPGRFNDVESPTALQFPEPVLATSELQRTVNSMERRVAEAEQRAAAAEQQAATVQTWAMGAAALGGLGLLVGLYGLLGSRRRDAPLVGQPTRAK